jgi:hypothetical protein
MTQRYRHCTIRPIEVNAMIKRGKSHAHTDELVNIANIVTKKGALFSIIHYYHKIIIKVQVLRSLP